MIWEILTKAGGVVALAAILTVIYNRITAKEANRLALRRLENEEEAALDKQRDTLLLQERELHKEQVALLKERIADLLKEKEAALKEKVALKTHPEKRR